jgi:hypothetical protein
MIKSLYFNRGAYFLLIDHIIGIWINLLNEWNSMSTYCGARLRVI